MFKCGYVRLHLIPGKPVFINSDPVVILKNKSLIFFLLSFLLFIFNAVWKIIKTH